MVENKNKLKYTNPEIDDIAFETQKMNLEAGYIGKFFGSKDNAPIYIAGIITFTLVVSGFIIYFASPTETSVKYWGIISPIISMTLGYMFGKS